ncbi:MAG: LPS assembly protein LptD [Hyphomonadaceae bacterium]
MVLRFACLASAVLTLAAGESALAQVSADEESGVADILLSADTISEDRDERILTATGNVEVRVGERVLRADRVIYDEDNRSMQAQGNVQISDSTGTMQFADEIEVDDEFRDGFATRFSMRWQNGGAATASSAVRTGGRRHALEQVVFTSCPICEQEDKTPTWSLRARKAVQNLDTKMISYQDAVLELGGIPVLYVPYFAHPDPTSGRRSGLMTPDFGVSSKVGAFYEQPYYWAISPSQELTVSPTIYANVNPLVKLDYRQRFFSGFLRLEGSFTNEKDFDSDGNKFGEQSWRSHLYGEGRFAINQNWDWGFGVETQTDDLYDLRYDIDGENDLRGLYSSQPRQLLSQIYSTGQDEDFYAEAGLLTFQGLRAFDDDARFPKVAPTLFAEKVFDFGDKGQVSTQFSAAALFRDEAQTLPDSTLTKDSVRATGSAEWTTQTVFGPGLVLSPFALGRFDAYKLDNGLPDGSHEVSRTLGLVGGQVSWPLIRTGKSIDIVVEPIAMVAYGTEDANQKGIPNEDSLLFEVDDSNVFKPDVVSNYDLWEGGARASVGLSTTARFGDGIEINGLFGRRWRDQPDSAFDTLSNLSGEKSDYVASVNADFGAPLRVGARVRFDDEMSFNRVDATVAGDYWRISGNARYFRTAATAAGAEEAGLILDGRFRIKDNWSAIVRQYRNITENRDILLSVGIGYQDDCSFFSIAYERNGGQDRTLGPSDSIRFRFVLTGLGGISDDSVD